MENLAWYPYNDGLHTMIVDGWGMGEYPSLVEFDGYAKMVDNEHQSGHL